jgi:hypothetical protein
MITIPLQSFQNRFAGKTGWVFGRGENTFDYRQIADIDGPVFFINDAVANDCYVKHGDSFWFALDTGHHGHLPTMRSLPVLHEGGWADKSPLPIPRVCWWKQDPTAYNDGPPEQMARDGILITRLGTICPLIHFAWFAGVRRLNLVGCDGIQKVDMKGIDPRWDPRLPNLSGKGGGCVYGQIRQTADALMERLGIEAEYVGTPAPRVEAPDLMVIAYHTDDRYAAEAENLRASLIRHGLKHRIDRVGDRGSWAANTSAKPTFVRRMLYAHAGPVLYLDADAVVQRPPVQLQALRPADFDLAVHYRRREGGPLKTRVELLSGTIWFGNTPACRELVERWEKACRAAPDVWDQKHLQNIVADMPGLRVMNLPPEYCCIFDSMREQHPGIEPVIEHFQASRRFKERAIA